MNEAVAAITTARPNTSFTTRAIVLILLLNDCDTKQIGDVLPAENHAFVHIRSALSA